MHYCLSWYALCCNAGHHRKGIYGFKSAQVVCFFPNYCATFLVFILYVGLRQVSTPLMLIWPSWEEIHTLLVKSGVNIYCTSSSFSNVDSYTQSAFFASAVVSQILHFSLNSMGTLPLLSSTEHSSITGVSHSWLQ